MQKINKICREIDKLEGKFEEFSSQELKNKTIEFKEKIKSGAQLDQILIEAFAVVREACKRVTGKRLYDVQIMGGSTLNQARIAEIKAGEGKTLTTCLPAYLNSLVGKGVHVITTNEYLAKRDYKEVGKILEYLGITVGLIYQNMDIEERKREYRKEVTYGTNTEFGFDYLRDNIATCEKEIVQRELYYAIIDEADSILLDEAQTPMIIGQKKYKVDIEAYIKANKFVDSLNGISIIKEEPKNKKQFKKIEEYDYVVDETYRTVELTQKGIKKAEKEYNIENFYSESNIEIIDSVKQALRAKAIFQKDIDYIVKDGKVLIIDKYTGRAMPGKRYTKGLHEAIETKEHLKIEESSEIIATITSQNYFKMYKKLAGMTGTAKFSEKEFKEIYQLDVVKIPTNRKMQRIDRKDKIFATEEEKYKGIMEEIKKSKKTGQPILIGTTSIEKSEKISKLLIDEGIEHNVLNAKNDEQEARIVEEAGNLNKVTIATNMAGRGTHIELGSSNKNEKENVIKAGGLKVIGTEKHETRRIDEQLRGRSGRQGQIGESIFYLSIEDELLKIYGNKKILGKYKNKKEIKSSRIKTEIMNAQKKAENRSYTARKRLVKYDEVLNKQREIIYADRRKILKGSFEEVIKGFIDYFCEQIIIDNSLKAKQMIEQLEKAENISINAENLKELEQRIFTRYIDKKEKIGTEEFHKQEKKKILKVIDENWIIHLENMEYLRDNIELRVYGGYNPIQEYNVEGKKMFNKLINKIKINIVSQLLFATELV